MTLYGYRWLFSHIWLNNPFLTIYFCYFLIFFFHFFIFSIFPPHRNCHQTCKRRNTHFPQPAWHVLTCDVCEWKMRDKLCDVWCGMWDVWCGMWDVGCVMCDVWCVMWYVVLVVSEGEWGVMAVVRCNEVMWCIGVTPTYWPLVQNNPSVRSLDRDCK